MCAQDLFMAARTSIKPGCFLRSALLLAGVVAFGGIALPVYGSEEDPFQVDTGHWMSFERYKDNVKAGRPVPTAPENTPADATPLETLVPVAAPEPVVTAPETQPVVAAPSRPLDLPVLPGVNQGFSVRVDRPPMKAKTHQRRKSSISTASPRCILRSKTGKMPPKRRVNRPPPKPAPMAMISMFRSIYA